MDFTCLGTMAGRQKRQRIPAPYLADDLIVDILVRLPERPLCRFKCVSRSWRDLISGPVHRRGLAHTDAASGFFYHVHGRQRLFGPPPPRLANLNFTALSSCAAAPDDGAGGSPAPAPPPLLDQAAFPFLPPGYARSQLELVDSCNGLLLLRCHDMIRSPRYVVCNPTTHGWAVELPRPKPLPINKLPVPPPPRRELEFVIEREEHQPVLLQIVQDPPDQHWIESNRSAALAFDPAVSSHFHVFELVEEDDGRAGAAVKAVRIYSSETGEWVLRSSGWSYRVAYAGKNACFGDGKWRRRLAYASSHAYLNGFLHLAAIDANNGMVVVAAVDTKGETWRVCGPELPVALGGGAPASVVGQSQRRLVYVDAGSGDATAGELSVYALESSGGGAMERWVLKHRAGRSMDDSSGQQVWFGKHHSVVGIHPDCSVIFLFDSREQSLIAYDIDRGTTRVLRTFTDATSKYRFVPYVPMYLQSE